MNGGEDKPELAQSLYMRQATNEIWVAESSGLERQEAHTLHGSLNDLGVIRFTL